MKPGQQVGAQTAEQAQRRADRDVAEVDERRHVHDFDLQHIAGLCAFDLDGTGEGVHLAEIEGENAIGL